MMATTSSQASKDAKKLMNAVTPTTARNRAIESSTTFTSVSSKGTHSMAQGGISWLEARDGAATSVPAAQQLCLDLGL